MKEFDMNKISNKVRIALLEAKDGSEVVEILKGMGFSISEENAAKLFDEVHVATGELSDDELSGVAGGASGYWWKKYTVC